MSWCSHKGETYWNNDWIFLPAAQPIIIIIIILFFNFFLTLVKKREGKKLRKAERGPKWKTSPGGPQRENRRAAIRR